MKKIIKRTLLVSGILIGVIIIFILGYMLKAKSEIKKFTPLETRCVNEEVLSIHDAFTNVYLVKSESGYIAFDAGNNIETVELELEKMNISPSEIIAVFLTHTDSNHVASIPLFEKAEIYLSKEEQRLINGEASRFLFFKNKIECEDYKLVTDNQVITIENLSVQCILTPGHTPGSTCYLVNGKYLFTGDALSIMDGKVKEFNHFFNMDTETQLKSIRKLSLLDSVEYIFTAHHGITNDFERIFK